MMQAIAEDPAGAAALEEDEQVVATMLSLVQRPASISIRGRAAALLAEVNAETCYRPFVQVGAASVAVLPSHV